MDDDPTFGAAFKRAFYEPGSVPPRFSLMRLMAAPLTLVGLVWLVLQLWFDWTGRVIDTPWWAGAILIGAGCALYSVNRFTAGPVSVEFGDHEGNEKP
jgi:hypothetical protein